jgi:hypothetical protein
MKLNSALVERTLSQFDAQAIPENHPAVPRLNDVFGEHTYFLNGSGLHVVEPADATAADSEELADEGKVVKLASWADPDRKSLTPHEPEPTDVVIPLKPNDS